MRRVWLFARDIVEELRCAWGMARFRDCDRRGHQWLPPADDPLLGWSRTCGRCGCGESLPSTAFTATSSSSITIDVGAASPTGDTE